MNSVYRSPGSWPDLGFLVSKQWRGKVRVFGVITATTLMYQMIFVQNWGKEDNIFMPVNTNKKKIIIYSHFLSFKKKKIGIIDQRLEEKKGIRILGFWRC